MKLDWINTCLGGRKFTVAMSCILLSFVALVSHLLTGAQWVTVVSIISALYKASNLAESKFSSNKPTAPPGEEDK